MDESTKKDILEKAKKWMREGLIASHKENTLKLVDLDEFNINPFLLAYLGFFLEGNIEPRTLAKVLLYPRILGTSITTSFGTQMQRFVSVVLGGFGSAVSGIDIEFPDKIDGRKKYAQIKSGPNAINRDDVTTVKDHFKKAINLARTNNLPLQHTDLVFCLLYGESHEKNSFIKEVEQDYVVLMGKEFWHRLTGDEEFYKDLILAMAEVANEVNMKELVEGVIDQLVPKIEEKLKEIYGESGREKPEDK